MIETRWPDVEAVLDRILEHDTADWPARVEAECSGDPKLRSAVETLLRQAAALDGFLDAPAASVRSLLDTARTAGDGAYDGEAAYDLAEGTAVGAWRLVRPLGRGGMGAVYLAERADGAYDQEAALKLVSAGPEAAATLRRFRDERQILARLDHPAIARLLDGGAADDGRPFFAMEYVEGAPLDAYCERRRLSVEDRLRLFLQVCDAVAYAHRGLVVHRDLKPSNVLVTEREGIPQVKLLDFGIARLLEDDAEAMTRTEGRALTPAYAAPEQVEGGPVGTGTDVWGLGVVLYELLASRRPFAGQTRAALERAILGANPAPPSAVAPEDRRRALAGDLDAVVLKALRKEPEARYTTANALAAEIRRHLDGLPVEARRGAAGYRVRKFVGRHRVGVLTALGIVALVGAVVGVAFARVTAERNRAQAEEQRAQNEADKARATSRFLASLFEEAFPNVARGDTLNIFEMIDRGAARARAELNDQPEVQVLLLRDLADVYHGLGSFEPARDAYLDAIRLARRLPSRDYTNESWMEARFAAALRMHNHLDEALRYAQEAVALARAHVDPSHNVYAFALSTLGDIHRTRGEYAEAEPLFREALVLRQRYNPGGAGHAEVMNNYALVLEFVGRFEEALQLYQQVLAIRRSVQGDDSPMIAHTYMNIAQLMYSSGDYAGTLPYALYADSVNRAVYAPEHPWRLGTQNTLGRALVKLGRLEEAESILQDVLDVERGNSDSGHRGGALLALAEIRGHQRRWAESEEMADEALRINTVVNGPESGAVGRVRLEQGRLALLHGDRREAADLLREALRIYRLVLPAGHPRIAEVTAELAEVQRGG